MQEKLENFISFSFCYVMLLFCLVLKTTVFCWCPQQKSDDLENEWVNKSRETDNNLYGRPKLKKKTHKINHVYWKIIAPSKRVTTPHCLKSLYVFQNPSTPFLVHFLVYLYFNLVCIPYTRLYNLWFVYLLSHVWSPFVCFKVIIFGKFCPNVVSVFKSGLKLIAGYDIAYVYGKLPSSSI